MRRSTMLAAFLLALVGTSDYSAGNRQLPAREIQPVFDVAGSKTLSNDEKIAELKKFTVAENTRMAALWQIHALDPSAAAQTAVDIFRAKDTSRDQKLRLGHFAIEKGRPKEKGFPQEFPKEFAAFLIGEILNGGEAEFCRRLPMHPLTAVGEYAYLASDFDGYANVDFSAFNDPHVIDVLIRCLDAPDNYNTGCIGKPGEDSGRNTARQQIPVALARLQAVKAIEPLRKVLRNHHDWWERHNSAFALAFLQPPEDHAKLIAELKAAKFLDKNGNPEPKDRFLHLFAFGRGLLQRGDDAGIELMEFQYSIYFTHEDLSAVLYMLDERLPLLRGVKSPKLEGFFTQAFANDRVFGLFIQDEEKVKLHKAIPHYGFPQAAPRIQKTFDEMCTLIEANRLVALRPTLEDLGRKTPDAVIKARAQKATANLEKN